MLWGTWERQLRRGSPPEGPALVVTEYADSERAVIYFCGVSGRAGRREWLARAMQAHVYSPSHPAHFLSEAECTRVAEETYASVVAAGFRPENIYVWGHSFGGFAATWLAANRECAGLVVHAAFSHGLALLMPAIAWTAERVGLSVFETRRWMAKVPCPVAIVHASEDGVCLPVGAVENICAAQSARAVLPVWIPGGHDALPDAEQMDAIVRFLEDS